MESSSPKDSDVDSRLHRREVVADLAKRALAADDLDRVLEAVVAAVAETLGCEYCGAFESLPDGETAVLRADTGWPPECVGDATVDADGASLTGETLGGDGPVVVDDLATDDRVTDAASGLPDGHDAAAAVGVRVGSPEDPWGVLAAYATEPGAFTGADGDFLRRVGDVVESAAENAPSRDEPVAGELEEIYGRISDAFFALDEDWRFTYLNDRAHELINPEDRALVGENVWEAFPEAIGRQFEAEYERAMAEQETVSFEEYYPEPLDAWFEVRAYPSESGLSVYFRDVTERRRTRQRLADERDMFARGPAVVFRWRNEAGWPVEYVSENVEDVFGYAPAELESGDVPYTDLLLDSDLDAVAGAAEATDDETTERFSHDPYRVETSDGDVRWVTDTTKAVRDEAGEITHYLGYLVDITGRKERERELERFETLFEESTDVNAVLNPDGTYQYLPPSVENVLGYEPDELAGELAFDYIHPEDREEIVAEFERLIEDPDYQPKREFRYRHADGSWIWLEASGRSLLDDPHIEGLVVYTRDVTGRKERTRELREKKRRFEAIFEDPNILVGLLEPDGTVLDINRTAMEYVDDDLEAVTGEPFWETPWWGEGDDVQDAVREWTERAAAGEYVDFETDLTRPDGERYTLDGTFRPVTDDDGDVVSIVVSDRDVTERRAYERRLEESEQRYRTLAERFPNGLVALFDEDLRYTLAAGQAFDYLPVSRDDVEGNSVGETWGEDVAADLEPLLDDALEGGSGSIELSYADRDWLVYAVPIADEAGNVLSAMTMAQDVTERKENERKLEESERRYRTLAEHFPNGAVGVYDEDLRYTLAEGTVLGDSLPGADRLEGARISERFPDDTVADLEPLFRTAVEDGETGSTTTRFGGRHWRVWATPLRDVDDEIFAGMSFAQDITDQVERERRLERYETIVETVDDGVYVVDEDDHFTMVNEAYAEMLGYPPNELVGRHVSAVVENDVIEAVTELQQSLEAGRVDEPSLEAELRTASGETFPAEATFALLPEDAEWHRVGVVRDVSDRKERERKLAESERRYRTLVENFPDGAVAMFDENMEYTVAGGQLLPEIGVDVADRVGNSVHDVYPDHLVEELEPYFEAALEGESNSFEIEFHDRHLYAHTLPVSNAVGDIFAGMLVVQDVTERREYERRLEESNERLEQFAYAASHDLQEPLRMVSSYLQLIERRYEDELDEEGEEFIEFAVDGAERMREMIEALLKYSRIETRGDPFEPVDLDGVLSDVREDLQVKIEESDAEITAEPLPTVEGDCDQLRQVVQNLLDNALEYSGEEPPRVHVGATREGDEWVISVADEGIGIDPDDAATVFEVFQRLHSREEYDGTGIGLALCERIVERHGGEIRVESQPGEGSTFLVTLPAEGDVDEGDVDEGDVDEGDVDGSDVDGGDVDGGDVDEG